MAKTADAAIEAMKQGAYDYLFKPLDLHQLRRVVGEALEVARRMREPAVVAETAPDPDVDGAIVGSCPAMREVYKAIGRVAAQNVPVLITGESGTGKELVARAIYQHGPRAKAPFLALNCAAIPENLLESELFGHEKGAFTGADRRRIGKFEQCNGGTLFLDEIGDMPLALQAKILRLLQEQTFERVGGNETIRTDVRLIAATHRDLKAWSAEGKFRPDLYYRLGVFTIHLPPLRERGDDLPLLVQHYLRRFSRELGREVREVAPEALERLRSYSWPGNIRELQSVLKQALLQASGTVLLPAFLPELAGRARRESGPARAAGRQTSAWKHSSANGSGRMPATCTRKRTARWTGSCCPASWSTPAGINTRPPACWGSPGKPCARNSATWGCTSRTPSKPTKTTMLRGIRPTYRDSRLDDRAFRELVAGMDDDGFPALESGDHGDLRAEVSPQLHAADIVPGSGHPQRPRAAAVGAWSGRRWGS